jgi:hypothetical protein
MTQCHSVYGLINNNGVITVNFGNNTKKNPQFDQQIEDLNFKTLCSYPFNQALFKASFEASEKP